MSVKNKRLRKSNVNLFFNQQINIFPEDFFSTFDKKSNSIKEKNKQIPHPKIILPKFNEHPKTNLYNISRNQNKNNEEITKNNFTNIIKLDNISNFDFSFKAPSTPDKKNNITNKIHPKTVITKNNSFQPIFRSPFHNKIKKYELVNKSTQNSNESNINNINKSKNVKNINNNNVRKFKFYNIKCNELFKETKLKFLKNKNGKNIDDYNQKEKEKEKNTNLNMTSRKSENLKTKFQNYRISTPIIKNKIYKKLLNINKSREIVLKSSSSKSINDKFPIIEKEKKSKDKSKDVALKSYSLKYLNNNSNSVVDTKKKNKRNSKILVNINNFNKRAHSSNVYSKNKNNSINTKVNKTKNNPNSKNNMKKTIKTTIDKIFKEMPKDFEDNPVILYKFNSLIRNMKNFQHIIKSKHNSFCSDNNNDEYKNIDN